MEAHAISSELAYADLVDADPAPRELTITGKRYVRAQASYLWVGLGIAFVVLPNVFGAALIPMAQTIGSAIVTTALAVGMSWWIASRRARLRKVLVDGTQIPARILHVSRFVVRSGAVRGSRDTVLLDVAGRHMHCVSWAGDLEDAEPGAWIRVLIHPQVPELAVPVVSVT